MVEVEGIRLRGVTDLTDFYLQCNRVDTYFFLSYFRYRYGQLIEINSHSLFSKWFSEVCIDVAY